MSARDRFPPFPQMEDTVTYGPTITERRTSHRGHKIAVRPGPLDFDCQIDGKHHGSYVSMEAAILAAVAHLDLLVR